MHHQFTMTFLSIIIVLMLFQSASGEQVVLVVDKISGKTEQGQGWTIREDKECWVVTPYHVVKHCRKIKVLFGNGTECPGKMKKAFDVIDGTFKNIDLALISLGTSCNCEFTTFDVPIDISHLLESGISTKTPGYILVRQEGIGLKRVDITVSKYSDSRFDFLPFRPGDTLHSGMSGSCIYLSNRFVGMLDSIDSRSNTGKAMRLDYIYKWIELPNRDNRTRTAVLPLIGELPDSVRNELTEQIRSKIA